MEWEIAGLVEKWTVGISISEQILQHIMDSSYNWKNIAANFMNTSLIFSILSAMCNSIFGVNVSVAS